MRNLIRIGSMATVVLLCGFLLFSSYFFLEDEVQKRKNPVEAIPLDAGLVLESENLINLWMKLNQTNMVWNELQQIPFIKSIDSLFIGLDSLHNADSVWDEILFRKIVLSVHFFETTPSFLACAAFSELEVQKLGHKLGTSTLLRPNSELFEFSFHGDSYYCHYRMPFLLISNSKELISKSSAQLNAEKSLLEHKIFSRLYKTKSLSAPAHLFLNFENWSKLIGQYCVKDFAEAWHRKEFVPTWAALDLTLKPDALLLTGLSSQDNSKEAFKMIFEGKSVKADADRLFPADLKSMHRYSVSEKYDYLRTDLELALLKEKCDCDPRKVLRSWFGEEIVYLQHGRSSIGLINSLLVESNGVESVLGNLSKIGVTDTICKIVNGREIYQCSDPSFLRLFVPEFEFKGDMFYFQVDDFAVFTSSEGVERLSYEWMALNEPLPKKSPFENFALQLMSAYSGVDWFSSAGLLPEKIKSVIKPEILKSLEKYDDLFQKLGGVVWQGSASSDQLLYHSLAVNVNQGNWTNINQLWSFQLDTGLVRSPELMFNHRTNTSEILVYDKSGKIHLIGATGKLKWSKLISGNILSKVYQVDAYQNGKWQMLFNTENHLHLIDVNGDYVDGFPKKLPSEASWGLTLFDYDGNKEYRVLIPLKNKGILNLTARGAPVKGWEFKQTQAQVKQSIVHFVSEGRDFLVFSDGAGNVYGLDRKGNARLSLKTKIPAYIDRLFVKGHVQSALSSIIFSDSLNRIQGLSFSDELDDFRIDSALVYDNTWIHDFNKDSWFEYVAVRKNVIEIYNSSGVLSGVQSFDFDLKNQVAIVNSFNSDALVVVQNPINRDIYLYNSELLPFPNFPAEGSLLACTGDMNKDGNIDLVTVVKGRKIIVYTLKNLFVF